MAARSRIFIAGGDTVIGAALHRRAARRAECEIVPPGDEPDLRDRVAVDGFFAAVRPTHVIVAAGRSGGIAANQRMPADLMLDNLLVSAHLIDAAHRYGVRRLLYLASLLSYPRLCPQPMRPEHLLTGPLEPTNEAYATAKLAGIHLCRAYRRQHGAPFLVGIPANAFGPGDDFDLENAHVIAALLHRMHRARMRGDAEVVIWGTGQARREFIFTDDLAEACLFVLDRYDGEEPINLGSGQETSIGDLARMVAEVVNFRGVLRFDASRPDGMPRKSLDSTVLRDLGWRPSTALPDAIRATYEWFLQTHRTLAHAHD